MPQRPSRLGFVATFVLAAVLLVQPFTAAARTPNDTRYDEQWYLDTISAPLAWDTETGSRNVVVAVLDTGVDTDHPDLEENIWENPGEIADNHKDDDGNGYVDDVHGWDFVDDDSDARPSDRSSDVVASHGTFIAGVIAAQGNNHEGTAGVSWQASIMPIRMLDADGGGDSAIAADAVDYAVANGADIINMSFAGVQADTVLRRSVQAAYNAGVVVVAAMGNEAENSDDVSVYPACFMDSTNDWVIGVASTDEVDDPSIFSNYGRECTDLSAPGENIFGLLYYDAASGYDTAYEGGWNGTSVASPIVAGAAALLLSAFPDLTVDEVRNALKLSVDPLRLAPAMRGKFGSGRVNVAQALFIGAQFSDGSGEDPTMGEETGGVEGEGEEIIGGGLIPRSDAPAVIALGNSSGAAPMVDVRNPNGTPIASFAAYADTYLSGIKVALGDLDGDNDSEVVTGTGAGGGPQVRVFTSYGALVSQFFAYDEASRQGVDVATGDVDGDGVDEIVTAVGSGVSTDVVVRNMRGVELLRFAAAGFAANAELRVATGDVDGDGLAEFIVTGGQGSVPRVAVYATDGTFVREFAPYAASFTGGVYVAAGDVDGDGVDEIVTGTGDGGGPHVRVFAGDGTVKSQFFAFDAASRQGVRVSVADTDRDGPAEIVAAPGPGMSELRIFSGASALKASWSVVSTGGEGTVVAAW